MSLVMDPGSLKDLNIKTLVLIIIITLMYSSSSMILPGWPLHLCSRKLCSIADLTVEAHEDIILAGVYDIHFKRC